VLHAALTGGFVVCGAGGCWQRRAGRAVAVLMREILDVCHKRKIHIHILTIQYKNALDYSSLADIL
jgi:hypothetical protein